MYVFHVFKNGTKSCKRQMLGNVSLSEKFSKHSKVVCIKYDPAISQWKYFIRVWKPFFVRTFWDKKGRFCRLCRTWFLWFFYSPQNISEFIFSSLLSSCRLIQFDTSLTQQLELKQKRLNIRHVSWVRFKN